MPACARRRLLDHYRVMAFCQALRLPTEETNLSVSGRAWRDGPRFTRDRFFLFQESRHTVCLHFVRVVVKRMSQFVSDGKI